MTDKKMLIGSLSNDLLRVSSLTQRGSMKAANRFLEEAKKWALELRKFKLKIYISNIVKKVLEIDKLSLENAEQILMYGILLQNYSLHIK